MSTFLSPVPTNIDPILRQLEIDRRMKGVPYQHIATATGYTDTAIHRALLGKVSPTLGLLTAVANYFGYEIKLCASSKPTK